MRKLFFFLNKIFDNGQVFYIFTVSGAGSIVNDRGETFYAIRFEQYFAFLFENVSNQFFDLF